MSKLTLGIIGSSYPAKTLAIGAQKANYKVALGSRFPNKLQTWHLDTKIDIGTYQEVVKKSQIIILAMKSIHASEALKIIDSKYLAHKIIIDSTNPKEMEDHRFGSIMETLQRIYPQSDFVKALSSVGESHIVNPTFSHTSPGVFICGDSIWAKNHASVLLENLGWEPIDMGDSSASASIEALCNLWGDKGFYSANWNQRYSK